MIFSSKTCFGCVENDRKQRRGEETFLFSCFLLLCNFFAQQKHTSHKCLLHRQGFKLTILGTLFELSQSVLMNINKVIILK